MSSISPSTLKTKASVSAFQIHIYRFFPATTLDHAPLEAVYIYFSTATFDQILRDEKVTSLTIQLSMSLKEIEIILSCCLHIDIDTKKIGNA